MSKYFYLVIMVLFFTVLTSSLAHDCIPMLSKVSFFFKFMFQLHTLYLCKFRSSVWDNQALAVLEQCANGLPTNALKFEMKFFTAITNSLS